MNKVKFNNALRIAEMFSYGGAYYAGDAENEMIKPIKELIELHELYQKLVVAESSRSKNLVMKTCYLDAMDIYKDRYKRAVKKVKKLKARIKELEE